MEQTSRDIIQYNGSTGKRNKGKEQN